MLTRYFLWTVTGSISTAGVALIKYKGSWSESIKNRLKHVRKYDAKKRKFNGAVALSHVNDKVTKVQKVEKQASSAVISADIWKELPNTTCQPDVHDEHIAALKEELSLSKPDKAKVRELMKSTYDMRRKNILSHVTLIKNIVAEYPPLATCAGICQEFGRIMKNANIINEEKQRFGDIYAGAILKYTNGLERKNAFIKNCLASLEKGISMQPEKRKLFQAACAATILPAILKSRGPGSATESLIEFTTEDPDSQMELMKESSFPRLIFAAEGDDIFDIENAIICAEGNGIIDFSDAVTVDSALLTLHASYYVFNLSYPTKWKDIFIFIDCLLCGMKGAAAKRISLQQFISRLQVS